jgi:hypothetical protein
MKDAPSLNRDSTGSPLTGRCGKLHSASAAISEDAGIQPTYSVSVYIMYILLSYYVVRYEPFNRPFQLAAINERQIGAVPEQG